MKRFLLRVLLGAEGYRATLVLVDYAIETFKDAGMDPEMQKNAEDAAIADDSMRLAQVCDRIWRA